MALGPGTRLGPYEIVGAIGAGGMGEVYRARDSKLRRDVALKILPESFAADPDRLARFHREAQVLASLNHPHIAAIYGFEDSGDTHALVLELVEGPTLADRIAQGPIPVNEAIAIAGQIADVLDAAHERGIVHRDLKPANIKLTEAGAVKVLDFGLAKALESESLVGDVSMSPTISVAATRMGVILGTAAYMAPEQARGKPVDRRADIWAFGCVLYEMVTGRRAFEGEEASDILAAILRGDPDWSRAPLRLRRLLTACLDKDRAARLQSIADHRLLIDAPTAPVSTRGRAWIATATVTVVIGVITWLAGVTYVRRDIAASTQELRLQIVTPADAGTGSFELSPNGEALVYPYRAPTSAGTTQLFLRRLASEDTQPVAGTEGTEINPFWSPDNESIGFFTNGQLKRVDLTTGLVRTLAPSFSAVGGSWSAGGTILFAPSPSGPLMRIRADGSGLAEATRLDPPAQISHRFPSFLPDGRHFLFFAMGPLATRGIYVGSLDSPETHRLLESDSPARVLPPDSLLYMKDGALLAQRLNMTTLSLEGEAKAVATRVAIVPG